MKPVGRRVDRSRVPATIARGQDTTSNKKEEHQIYLGRVLTDKPEPRNAGLCTLTHHHTSQRHQPVPSITRPRGSVPSAGRSGDHPSHNRPGSSGESGESGDLKRPVFVNLSRSRVRICIRLLRRDEKSTATGIEPGLARPQLQIKASLDGSPRSPRSPSCL
jgi:hypothetical protein